MISQKNILLLALVLSLALAGSNPSQQQEYLMVGQSITGFATKDTHFLSFNLLKVRQIKDDYLFFIATPKDQGDRQNFILSVYPAGQNKSLIQCKTQGIDACFLEKDMIQQYANYVIAIDCQHECEYTFTSLWGNIKYLQTNDYVNFYFSEKGKAQIYRVTLAGEKFDQLKILLSPKSRKTEDDQIKIYGNFGEDTQPTQQKYDFISQTLWGGSQVIFLNSKDIKSDKLTLLIVGQSQIIYSLSLETINGTNHQIVQEQKQIMQLDSGETEYLNFKLNKNSTYEQLVFGFSFMNGMGKITFYSDQNFKIPFEVPFISYMQDFQYYINSNQVKQLSGNYIYAKVQTTEKNTVFMVKYQTRGLQTPVQFTENIYEFVAIQNEKLGYLYFDARNFRNNDDSISNDSQIDFSVIRASGKYETSFRICTVHALKCIDPKSYKQFSKPIAVTNQGEVGMKAHYKITIKQEQLMEINSYQRRGILLIEFINLSNDTAVAAGHYSFGNAIQNLRLGHPLEQIMQQGDEKVFKYVNTDSNIQSVRFHINQIKGLVETKIYKENPLKNSNLQQIDNRTPIETEKLYQPLYLVVKAKELSIVGLSVQEINNQQKITALSLTQSIPYTIRIQPGGEESIKLNPLYSSVNVNFKATGSVMICTLSSNDNCKQEAPLYTKQGSVQFERQEDENILLLVNPNQEKFIEISLTYHSITGDKCDMAQIGQIYQENVASGSCFVFLLNTIEKKLSINAQRIDLGPFKAQAQICGFSIIQTIQNKLQLSVQKLNKYCKGKSSADRKLALRIYSDSPTLKDYEPFKVQFHAQYDDSIIDIPDGLAYRCASRNTQGMLKKFYYKAVNLMDTKILLRSYDGNVKVFGKIIDKYQKTSEEINSQSYDFSTTANEFIRNPASVITVDMFKNDNCQICSLLLAVYSDGDVGSNLDYSLEITQNSVILKDNNILQNTLQQGSLAFYEYTSIKNENCNLIIETSDHNRQCTKIYLSDRQNPNENNNLVVENGNKLVYPNCRAQTYYIAVQATSKCSYGIEVTNSQQSIVKIERGKPININLKQNQVKFIIFRHISPKQFKIMAMNQYGAASIYATPFTEQLVKSIKSGQNVSLESFDFKSELINSLLVEETQSGFCSNCYYIGAIKAQSELISTAILADRESITELSSQKILTDQLSQDTVSRFYFTNVLTGVFQIIVYEGQIEVGLKYNSKENKQSYSEAKQVQKLKFDFNSENEQSFGPIKLDISCKKSYCYYSIGLKDQTVHKRPVRKISGNPEYILISKNQNSCVSGYLEEEDSKIILSVSKLKKQALKDIKAQMKIDGKDVLNVPTEVYSNIMIISPKTQPGKTQSFELCLSTNNQDNLFVIVEEGENVKILPENEDTLSVKNSTYIVYPNGQLLIDVFDCTGDATFKYSTSEKNLINDENMTLFTSIAMPQQPHALKLTSFLPTYLQFQGQKSIVRWMDFNPQEEQGVGYEKYSVGSIRFHTQGENLNIEWGSLKKKMQTKTNVKATSYTLFISSNEKLVKYASQCEVQNSQVVAYHIKNIDNTLDKQLTFTIPKADLESRFSKDANLFMVIAADMQLTPPSKQQDNTEKDLQFYRFFYSQQQIPNDIYKGDYSSESSNRTKIAIIITAISIMALAIVGIVYLVLKKLVPLVSRMKNRVLLQEAAATESQPVQSNERIVVELS